MSIMDRNLELIYYHQLGFIVPLGHCSTSIFDCPTFEMQKSEKLYFRKLFAFHVMTEKDILLGQLRQAYNKSFAKTKICLKIYGLL